jgi:hypothetical protein
MKVSRSDSVNNENQFILRWDKSIQNFFSADFILGR